MPWRRKSGCNLRGRCSKERRLKLTSMAPSKVSFHWKVKQRAVLGIGGRAWQGKQRASHYFCGSGSKKTIMSKTDPVSNSVSKNWWEGAVSACLQSVSMNICLYNWSLSSSNIVLRIFHELFYLSFITVSGNIRMYFYCSYVMNEFAKTPELVTCSRSCRK